jgi:hypothetical protein
VTNQKKIKSEDFEKFLKRNIDMIFKGKKLLAKKPVKVDGGYGDCTLKPTINERSN